MGHRSGDVWEYTPRQLEGFLDLAERRKYRELIEQLHLITLGQHGDVKEIKKQIKQWEARTA